jgi:putative mRNA 3-end processing factor
MIITFYGGASEVGRSCISIDDKYLFDAGIKISEEGSEYPLSFDVSQLRAVFISHAHLDHTGALPLFNHKGLKCPIFCTGVTKDITKILLKDSLHIEQLENLTPGYNKENIYNVMGLMKNAKYNKKGKINDVKYRFYDAGHIPGSASILLKYHHKKILYTGDINSTDTFLLKGSDYNIRDVDVMICESTYGDRDHSNRQKTVTDFLNKIQKTLDRGGTALIPAFAVGRSQEVLMMLASRKWKCPIYLDGMSKKITNIFQRRSDFLKEEYGLKDTMKNVKYVKNRKERKEIVKEQAIIVTTSGMLDGGPVIDYLSSLYFDEKSSVYMTGYQAEETNGRLLLNEGKAYIDGLRIKIRCEVEKFDFSAHSGQKELVNLINKINPKHLILNHGDEPSLQKLSSIFNKKFKVYTPKNGVGIKI